MGRRQVNLKIRIYRIKRNFVQARRLLPLWVPALCLAAGPVPAAQGGHFDDGDREAGNPRIERLLVTGTREGEGYRIAQSAAAGFTERPVTEIPQAVQILSRDFLQDSGALSLGEALNFVAGASPALGRSVPFGTASVRLRGQDAAIFRDGLRDVDFSDIDQSALTNIERVEILKGPGGLVYGPGGAGGVVNLVTKKPLDDFRAEFSATLGQRGTRIGTADVNVPITEGLGFRMTAELERSDGFIDFSNIERDNITGTLGFDNGGPFRGRIVVERFSNRDDDAMTRVGLPPQGTIIGVPGLSIDRSTYLGEPGFDFTESFGSMTSLYTSYDIAPWLTWDVAARYTDVNFDQAELRTLGALDLDTFEIPRSRGRVLDLFEDQFTVRSLFKTQASTGPISHDLAFGYEYFSFFLFVENLNVPNVAVPPISVVNPVYLDNGFQGVPLSPFEFTSFEEAHELFLQDVIAYGPLTVTGAVRQVWTEFERGAGDLQETLYQIGATYEVTEGFSLFAGTNTGFEANGGLALTRSRTGDPFEPEFFRQVEGGIKTDLLYGLTSTLSYFELTRDNILIVDPIDPAFDIQAGRERTRGFEADILWQMTEEVTLRGGYAFLDAEIVDDTNPDFIGRSRPSTPRHQVNIFGAYRFLDGPLANLGVTAGVTYVDEAFASLSNEIVQPGFTTANFTLSYEYERVRMDAILTNAFDEVYFIARNDSVVNPGEPRLFTVRLSVIF